MGEDEIRCTACGKLLAKVLPSGEWEVRYRSRHRVIIRSGSISCPGCSKEVSIEMEAHESAPARRSGGTWGR